jgi:hypothetical protein
MIQQEIVEAHLPEGHLPRIKSPYFDPEVVGDTAKDNLKRYLQQNFNSISECIRSKTANTFVGNLIKSEGERSCDLTRKESRTWLEEQGWFPTTFRAWTSKAAPEEFQSAIEQRKSTYHTASKRLRSAEIGSCIEQGPPTVFAKGEAFEQLVAACLLLKYPEAQIVPQYCLKVAPPNFGTRADFMLASEDERKIIEVKWGGNIQNIRETEEKHRALITSHESGPFQYEIVALEQKMDSVTPVSELISQSPHLQKTLEQILIYVEQKDSIMLGHLRDYLYSGLDVAYGQRGTARTTTVNTLLENLMNAPWGERENTLACLKKETACCFIPTVACYEYKGQLYSGHISIPALLQETPSRGRLLHYFADLHFTNRADRDLAIMLELSQEVATTSRTCTTLLQSASEQIIENAVFTLSDGRKFTTSPYEGAHRIEELSQLSTYLHFPDDAFEFGQQFIAFCG